MGILEPQEANKLKKPYSLDYSIERDTDRVAAVKDILDSLPTDPNDIELEQMASYILYGKDEDGLNAVKRGEMMNNNTRYSTFRKKEDKNASLDAMLEEQQPIQAEPIKRVYTNPKPTIRRPKYDRKTGELVDIGDGDIPGMVELWEAIDRLDKWLAINEGKLPPDEDTNLLPDSYRVYQLRHQLADMRKHQYLLKDVYKPVVKFLATDHPKTQFIDWTSDSFYWISMEEWRRRVDAALTHTISKKIDDYEVRENPITGEKEVKWVVQKHTFNWEDPLHVRALINNLDTLRDYLNDKLDTYGRTLIWDFERYCAMAHLTPVREFLLQKKIEKASYTAIAEELRIKFGVVYNENHISTITSKEIPATIAIAAKKYRVELETPDDQKKKCYTCGRLLPRTPLFFGRHNARKDHFASNCKECEKQKRIMRGGQAAYDKRSKDTTLSKV